MEVLPVHQTLGKCYKHLCQTEQYRMLSDWSYKMNGDPLDEGSTAGHTDVERNTENDLISLQNIHDEVLDEISLEQRKTKMSRKSRNKKRDEVKTNNNIFFPIKQ